MSVGSAHKKAGKANSELLSKVGAQLRCNAEAIQYTYISYFVILLLLIYRISVIVQPHLTLFFDEAYYYHWSQILDFGYYSKPPVVAWFIAASTALFGVSDAAVKFFSPVLYAITAFFVHQIASTICNRRVACYAVLIFSTAPLVGFNSLFITTDSPLFFFWALSIYLLIRCEKHNKLLDWVSLGLCLGLGMLSKYTFALLPLGFIGYLFSSRQTHFLFEKRVYLAVAISLSIASVNLVWNAQHHFVSFSHTHEIAQIEDKLFDVSSLMAFLASQFLIFGAVSSALVLTKIKGLHYSFQDRRHYVLILWVTLPILLVISFQALLSRAFANWAGPYMVGASILAAIAVSYVNVRVLLGSIILNLALLFSFNHLPSLYRLLNVEQSKTNSPYARLAGWKDLGQEILADHPDINQRVLVSSNRDVLAYVGFYVGSHVDSLSFWNADIENVRNHYDLRSNAGRVLREVDEAMYISKVPLGGEVVARFSQVKLLDKYELTPMKGVTRKLYLYEVMGFKGY